MSRCNESAAGTSYQIDLCALQDFAARWSAIWFDLCSRETEMRVTVARKHRKHRKQCQWRSVETLHSCAMLRVACAVTVWTWSQEAWTIRTGEFVTKSGRYGTHLDAFGRIWYERNNQKIIPFHRCETETVPVLFDLQEETVDICWLARCHSVTVSQCCTSRPAHQFLCDVSTAGNNTDHDWCDGSDVARVNIS
jgi:hypothetical protein